jgi:hypothetical protein
MYRTVVLVGTAPDGPEGIITDVSTQSYLEKSFGWSKFEHHTLPASGSAFTTRENIFGESFEIWEEGTSLLKSHQLYSPSVTASNTISFPAMPASADYILKYTPDQDENSLLLGALDYQSVLGLFPSVVRIHGTKSSVTIDDYVFSARYSGARYDGILIEVTTTTLSIYDPNVSAPKVKTYDITNGFNALNQIKSDYNLGMIDVDIAGPRRADLALTAATYTLTGGVAGTVSSGSVIQVIDDLDLSQVGYIAICGGMSFADITAVANHLESVSTYVPMLIVGSTVSLSGSVTSGYLADIQSWGLTSERVIYTPGWVNVGAPIIGSRWTAPTALFAAYIAEGRITNQALPAAEYSPIWTKAELTTLKSSTCPLNRFIKSGVGFYNTVNLASQSWPRLSLIEFIVSKAYPVLDSYIGKIAPTADEVANSLQLSLTNAPYAKALSVMVGVARDTIDVEIMAELYGEVDEIVLSLSSKR